MRNAVQGEWIEAMESLESDVNRFSIKKINIKLRF